MKKLSSLEQLEGWLERSRREPVWVFKHSLTCPISSAALEEYRAFVSAGDSGAGFGLIEIQTARPLSDELARRTGVRHESPQALLLHNGEAVWNASHWSIKADALSEASAAVVA